MCGGEGRGGEGRGGEGRGGEVKGGEGRGGRGEGRGECGIGLQANMQASTSTSTSYACDSMYSIVMHLSILGPTTPWTGKGGGLIGDLTAFDLKNRPKGWGI